MTMRSSVSVLCLAMIPLARAQSFQTHLGGNLAEFGFGSVANASFHRTWCTTYTGTEGHVLRMMEANPFGVLQSSTDIPLPGRVFAHAVREAPNGGSYIAGSLVPPGGDHDHLLVRVDGQMNVLWTSTTAASGSRQLLALATLADGSVVATGIDAGIGNHDVLVMRFDLNGSVLWATVLGGQLDEEGRGIAVDAQGIMVTGRQVNFGGESDAWFARLSLAGQVQWESSWGGAADEVGNAILRHSNGSFIMAGRTGSFGPLGGAGHHNLWLLAMNAAGDTLWTRAIGDATQRREGFALAELSNGDVVTVGERWQGRASDALAVRITPAGTVLWQQSYDLELNDRLVHVRPAVNGFVASGWTFGPLSQQVLLVRKNDQGN